MKLIERNLTLKNASKGTKNIYSKSLGENTAGKKKRMYCSFIV